MGSEAELVMSIWETFRDAVAASKREDKATTLLKIFEDWGVSVEDIAGELSGVDAHLDKAIKHFVDLDEDDEDEEDY